MQIEVIAHISPVETIATGRGIREFQRLERMYGHGRWRKLKCLARVRIDGGLAFDAEIHWYEAAGVGRRELKIKRLLGD